MVNRSRFVLRLRRSKTAPALPIQARKLWEGGTDSPGGGRNTATGHAFTSRPAPPVERVGSSPRQKPSYDRARFIPTPPMTTLTSTTSRHHARMGHRPPSVTCRVQALTAAPQQWSRWVVRGIVVGGAGISLCVGLALGGAFEGAEVLCPRGQRLSSTTIVYASPASPKRSSTANRSTSIKTTTASPSASGGGQSGATTSATVAQSPTAASESPSSGSSGTRLGALRAPRVPRVPRAAGRARYGSTTPPTTQPSSGTPPTTVPAPGSGTTPGPGGGTSRPRPKTLSLRSCPEGPSPSMLNGVGR